MTHTYRFTKVFLLCLIFLSASTFGYSQEAAKAKAKETSTAKKKSAKKGYSRHIGLTLGGGYATFRDFATSPLIYQGGQARLGISFLKEGSDFERAFELYSDAGIFWSIGKASNTSIGVQSSIDYRLLYRIATIGDHFNLKIGPKLRGTVITRINQSLGNNTFGLDILPSLMGTLKLEFDYRNTINKRIDVVFDCGVINSSYRNGFIYSDHSSLLNNFDVFNGYRYRLFSGLRLGSQVNLTHYLSNNNGLRISYDWDFFGSFKDFNAIEYASHRLIFTLLFNTNNQ